MVDYRTGHEAVRTLVRRHHVCWEVWPEEHINRQRKRVQIGFDLDLMGIHDHPAKIPLPGCSECVKVYNDLKQIARWILPKETRESRYEIGFFDSSIHYAPERKLRPDIRLRITIFHRQGFDQPTDACEIRCLREMEERLRELGAQKGQWRAPYRGRRPETLGELK